MLFFFSFKSELSLALKFKSTSLICPGASYVRARLVSRYGIAVLVCVLIFFLPTPEPQHFQDHSSCSLLRQGNVSAYKASLFIKNWIAVPSVPVTITADAF